jgi:MFS family permease
VSAVDLDPSLSSLHRRSRACLPWHGSTSFCPVCRQLFGPIAAGSAALFQLANVARMPLLSGILAYEGMRQAAPLIAALIVVPQLLVGLLAPWVGRSAEKHGRKPLLLVGFAALPIRAVLFALISNPRGLCRVRGACGLSARDQGGIPA